MHLRHRVTSLAILAVATVLSWVSYAMTDYWDSAERLLAPLPYAAAVIVGGVVVTTWIAWQQRRREQERAALALEATRLAEAAQRFGARVEAWLVATMPNDELEAEALRRTVVERHMALVAAIRAHLEGRDPHEDTVVQAMTREKERKGRHGPALLQQFAALQREALTEAQRRGFFGEARLLVLDEALFTLSAVRPREAPKVDIAAKVLAYVVPTYAALLVLSTSQRLNAIFVGAAVGAALILFEALTSQPEGPDPRIAALAAVIEG